MKLIFNLSLASAILFTSCGPTPEVTEQKVAITTETVEVIGPAKSIANISIKGMSCEMSCVSSINKTLKNLNGVKTTDIDFDTEREVDKATIEFDPKLISANDMVSAIEGLYEGQYEVTDVHLREEKSK